MNDPAANTAPIRHLWLPPLIWIAAIFSASCWSGPDIENPFWFEGLDKIIHVLIYTVLAQFLFAAFRYERRAGLYLAATLACLCTTLYGITDEGHQSFTPGRAVEGLDVLADFIGGTSAFLTAWYLHTHNGVETWIRKKLVPVSKS